MTAILITNLAGGVLLTLLSLPLLFNKIPPNPIYGFRVSKTLDNPAVWYAANRYSAKWLLGAGLSILVAAILFYFIPGISIDGYAVYCLVVFIFVLTIGLIKSFRYIRTL